MRRTGVILSDLHVGSRWAIFPPNFQVSTGELYQLNKGQEYLLSCFHHMEQSLPRRFDFLIINGEHTHGKNPKDDARDLIEQAPEFQARAAVELLSPLAKRARAILVTQGSTYHTDVGGQADEECAYLLGAYPAPDGHYAWGWALWNIDGILLDVAHRQSVTIRYGGMPLEREQQFDRMNADIKGGSADIIIRAHTHTYKFLNIDGELSLSTPAWTLQDRFAQMGISPNRTLSRLLGAARIDLYPDKKIPNCKNKEEYIKVACLWYEYPTIGFQQVPI